MRRVSALFTALFLAGTACSAANIPDIAVDTLHGYAYTTSMVTQVDSAGQPHIYPRQIDQTDCANLEDAKKVLAARAANQLSAISPQADAGHASVKFVLHTPKALEKKIAFTPNYPAKDEATALMEAQGYEAEKLFAEALQKSNIFGTVTVVDSDMPADEPVDGFQYKVWLDDKLDGKSVMAWILANAKGEKRPVQVTVGYGQNFGGLPDMVARMKTAIDQFPAE